VTRRGRRLATEYGFQDFRQSRRRGRHRIELAPRIRRLVRSRGRVRVTVKAKVEQRAMADKRVVRRYTVTR
jgi:hypothetical protein